MQFSRRRIIGSCLAAAAMLAPAAAQAAEPPRADPWQRTVERQLDAATLGLPGDASAPRLARAGIAQSQAQLGLRGSHGGLQLARSLDTDGFRRLTFEQTLGGLRVLWSQVDVAVGRDGISSISGTTVRLSSRVLPDRRRLTGRRARDIAMRAVPGRDSAIAPQLVAYAGEPDAPRDPRRAYVVQVTPGEQTGDEQQSVAVVIDAATGEVLMRRAGTVALPDRQIASGPTARAAATTTLYQIANFAKQPGENNYPYGKTDRTVNTNGNPYGFGEDVDPFTTTYNGFDTALTPLSNSMLSLGWYHCVVRDYCGRDGGNPGPGGGDFNRFFVVGNWNDGGNTDASQYQSSDEHILIGKADTNDRDVLAHEFGHLIDHHYRDDYLSSFEGQTVKEALADMFFIDAMRSAQYDDGSGYRIFSGHTQAILAGPHTMAGYSCTTTDEHDNSSILTHAYWVMADLLGGPTSVDHDRAGRILTYIPWALPAKRTFGSVRTAFKNAARGLYGAEAEAAVNQAFDHVNVYEGTQHLSRCPQPPPPPPPICDIKPWLPQCEEMITAPATGTAAARGSRPAATAPAARTPRS